MSVEENCVLNKMPCVYTYIKTSKNELFYGLRQQLLKNNDVSTLHECQHFEKKFNIWIIIRRVANDNSQSLFTTRNSQTALFIHCPDLNISEEKLATFSLSEMWSLLKSGELETFLTKKLLLEKLGKKSYLKSVQSALERYQHCDRGLYKVRLQCNKCDREHRVLVTNIASE